VARTPEDTGLVREMTLREVKRLDAGYKFTQDSGETYPYRGQGVIVPTLEEVYREFPDVPVNVEIKEARPDIEQAVWKVIEEAEAAGRTLVVSETTPVIRRFRKASSGRVATASSIGEIVAFDLLRRLRLSKLLRTPYQALQGPEVYGGIVHIVTPRFVRAAHEQGLRVDVWTINSEPDMRRLLAFGVDGIMTDRPDVLAQVLDGAPQ
jgi:glycerophosphoryl diester phosphodiesterase